MDLEWNLDQLLGFYMKRDPIFKSNCQFYVPVLNEKILVLIDLELQ